MTKILGTLTCPALMSYLGRRRTHLLTTLPAFVHWNLFTFASSLPVFIIARLLQGYAIGIHATMNSMLIAEYTDPKYRASFAAVTTISMGLGIIWVHFSGTLLDWRMTAAVCSLLPVSTAVVTWLSPETPSWLVSKERYEEARKVFLWLRGDGDEERKEIEDFVADHKKNRKSDEDKGKKGYLIENLKRIKQAASVKEFYQPLAICLSFCLIYEFGGVHYMPAYGNLILKYLLDKSDAKDVNWQLNALDILRPVSAGLAVIVLKNVKRRTIIFLSGGLTITSFISMSIYLYVRDAGVFKQSCLCDIFIMSLMVLYTVAFNIGLCPIYLVIFGEIIPLAFRGISSSIVISFLSPSTFTVMKSAPYMYSALGVQGTFLVYSLILSVCLSVVYVLLPETKDRTLLDIEKEFKGRRKVEEIADVEMKLMSSK
ncbi:facilitated trehalose transporter Tret1 [Plutella xylostella]|uniref:facilitated trehalose transporter Tret1 n=1 Tax=Plutella xylostella TaxID=51655 RepID=UPI0020323048|nr:facilitated trehalose transporter Tret1 [Plutella xylostella]